MEKLITVRFLLSGRVQRVGCRAQVHARANALGGLQGWVRNLDDGRVELLARGTATMLARLEVALRTELRAPVRVDVVERDELSPGPALPSGAGFGVEADSPGPWPSR